MKKKALLVSVITIFMFTILTINVFAAPVDWDKIVDGSVFIADYQSNEFKDKELSPNPDPARGGSLSAKHGKGYLIWVIRGDHTYLSYCIGYGRNVDGSARDTLLPNSTLINGSGEPIENHSDWLKHMEYICKYCMVREIEKVNDFATVESYAANTPDFENQFFAGQVLMWGASEGFFENTNMMNTIINSFCAGDERAAAKSYAQSYYNKALAAYNATKNQSPTKFNQSYEMTWDGSKYSVTITEPNFYYSLANQYGEVIKCDVSTDPNLQVSLNGNSVTISSSQPIGSPNSPVAVNFARQVGENTGTVYFGQAEITEAREKPQPVATFVPMNLDREHYSLSVYTNVGNLSVVKKDEHGNIVNGVTFRVTGPHGFDQTITTSNNEAYMFNNIPVGTYSVTEVNVPSGLYNQSSDRTQTITVQTNQTATFIRTNPYQRGKVTLVKYDANSENPRGDVKLSGAEFEFGAAEDIYEGNTLRYKAGAIEKVTTDEQGKTKTFVNLPIGKYYYKETKASEGYNLNGVVKNVEIRAQGQDSPEAATYVDDDRTATAVFEKREIVYCPEDEITVSLEIEKLIDETDYDPAELLKDVQFKLTLNSNPEVVYYTHGSNGGELSTADGLCILEDIPYGVYTVHEEKFPPSAIPCADFEANFTKETNAFKGKIYNKDEDEKYFVHNKPKTMQIEVNKMIENEFVNKTDAEVSGAVFTVYTDAECTQEYKDKLGNVVTIGPTNDDGYAISGKMRTQNYWLKETTFPEHMDENIVNPNAKKFNNPEGTTYKDMIYAVEQSNEDQPIEVDNVINTQNIENKPDSSRVIIVKYDDKGVMSEDSLPLGATVRLVLDSHPEVYYDVVVNEYGYLDFENKEVKEKYYGGKPVDESFTIPYGVYTLKEISESDDGNNKDWYFQNKKVYVTGENDVKPFILADYDVEFMLDIVKIDTDTGAKVGLPNAGYMVYSKEKEDFVELKVHDGTDNPPINVFYTNNQGNLKLPEKIPAGEYVLYEVKAPKGYYLEDGLRLPYKDNSNPIVINEEDNVTYISKDDAKIDQSKLGKTDFGGKLIPSTKENLNLPKDGEYPTNPVEAFKYALENLTYTVEASDRPDKFQIELYKTGDMFSGVKEETYNENGIVETVKIPQYTKEGLNGVTFKITAVEDILSEDGTQVYRNAGWSTTMTTGENGQPDGYAVSEKLYNGKYRVEEIVTPVGYKKCDSFEVDEHNYDQYNDVLQVSKEADNEYQPVTINFSKLFENQLDTNNPIYLVEGETLEEKTKENYAVFGLYNKNDLNSAKNNKTIKADSLMYVASVKSGEEGKISSLLPDGEYYLKELYVNSPYSMVDDQFVININHRAVNNEASVLKVEGPEIENYVEGGDFALVKTSVLDALNYFDLPAMTKEVDIERLEPLLLDYSERTTDSINDGEATIESVINDLKARGVRAIGSAEYELYADENMTKHVIVSKDGGQTFENVTITSEGSEYDSLGVYLIKGLPNGAYYLKETKAPKYMDNSGNVFEYDLYDGAIPFTIGNDKYDGEEIKFRIVSDTMPTISISKTDIFTSEPIENCLFTITDENGKELIRFVTNEHGKAEIPTEIFEDGKKYYFTELDAPKYPYYDGDDLYELNKEPHEFIAHIDEEGKWKFKEIDEEGNETIIEKIEIVNYRVSTDVELLKLDMVDSTAIPNCKFVLESKETGFREEGITDENGIYVFKNVPYGKYTYTELEAPEGWMIDTTPHEFTLDSHGTKIVVYDERKVELPDTGDVNVIVLSAIGVMSLITISVILKKKYIISK